MSGISEKFQIQAVREELPSLLQMLVDDGRIPGAAVVVSTGGERVQVFAGQASIETQTSWSAGSRVPMTCLMKFYTSLAAIDLAQLGKLDLEAPIETYIEEFGIANQHRGVCVKHLLSHSSGWQGVDLSQGEVRWAYNWQKFMEYFYDAPQLFSPGHVFSYDHSDHVILGEILRRVTGRVCVDLIKETIFDPLSIVPLPYNDSSAVGDYSNDGNGKFRRLKLPLPAPIWDASVPHALLTLSEIAEIGDALATCSRLPLISPAVFEVCRAPYVELPARPVPACVEQFPGAFSLACGLYGDDMIGHNASAFGQTCAFRLIPSRGVTIVVAMNSWLPALRDQLVNCIRRCDFSKSAFDIVFGNRISEAPLERVMGNFHFHDVSGTYFGRPFGEVCVEYSGDVLMVSSVARKMKLLSIERTSVNGVRLTHYSPHAVSFFPDPDSDLSALAVGVHALKKVGSPAAPPLTENPVRW